MVLGMTHCTMVPSSVKEKFMMERTGKSRPEFFGTHVFYNYSMKDDSQCFHVCFLRMTVSHKPPNL